VRRLVIGVLLGACVAAAASAAEPGFVSLFNGRNLDGWVVAGNPEGFTVLDGCIHSDGGKGGNWIRTAKQYGNFVLRLEWMLSKTGNSGVFIRNGKEGGFEVQLLAPWTPHRDDLHCTGSIYGHVPANPRPDETTLRWRRMEVTAEYKHITVKVDGITTCQADYDQVPSMKNMALVGYVGMQDSHTGPGEWVKFRNIEITDLDEDPACVAQGLKSSDSSVRRLAFDAAVRLGAPMVPLLLDMIRDGDQAQRHTAEMALRRVVAAACAPGAETQAVVARLLAERVAAKGANDAPDRASAARLLGMVAGPDPETIAALHKALLEGGPVAAAALESMQRIPGAPMTEALVDTAYMLPAELPSLLLAIGSRKDDAALPFLAEIACNRSGETQMAAVRALGLLGSAKSITVLRDVGGGASEPLRQAVVDALIVLIDARGLTEADRLAALGLARELAVTDAQKAAVGIGGQ
jgi:hypothetical protein